MTSRCQGLLPPRPNAREKVLRTRLRYVRKGNAAKNLAILGFIERTQSKAAHAQLLEKLRLIALAESCRFLTIQSLEFQEIWQKNSSETTQMIYDEKSEF